MTKIMTPDISYGDVSSGVITPLPDLHPPGVFVNRGMLGVSWMRKAH